MKYKIFFVFAISLILVGGGCNKVVTQEAGLPINPNPETTLQEELIIEDTEDGSSGAPLGVVEDLINVTTGSSGTYEAYSPEKLVLAKENNVILFFHAAWCPTCRSLEKNLNKTLDEIPSDLNILKVDYDNSFELRKKYKITVQHTLVWVDENGNLIKKWIGGNDLQSILNQIN